MGTQTPVYEITPAEVKKTIAGNGRATKGQVADALEALLGFQRGTLPFAVTDAVAIALAFAMNRTIIPSVASPGEGRGPKFGSKRVVKNHPPIISVHQAANIKD